VVNSRWSEAWWAVLLASAPSRSDLVARVCGGTVGTVNVGSRAPVCPPFIVLLDLHISSLLDNPLIHKSVHRAHYIITVNYVLSDTMTTIYLSVSKQIFI
jgi:hypothetical protein